MPAINTNISALHGLVNLNRAEADLNEASQRLSSGKKLNSASDDAAGLAIATRMTSQIRGLNMAMKNTNDGISMIDSIEGSLEEVINMLQRMRELAVQSGNDINSGKDRGYLQDEVNQFKTEITSISTNTQFNGTNVLDGTLSSKVIQTGMNSGQSITFSVDSVAASQLGSYQVSGSTRAAVAANATVAGAANTTTNAEDIIVHGNNVSKTIDIAAASTAKAAATAINAETGSTGVSATAKTYAHLFSTAGTATYSLEINGTSTGNFSIGSTSVGDAVTKINQIKGTTGVTATANAAGTKVLLYHSQGEDLTIVNGAAGTDLDVQAIKYDGSTVQGSAISLAQSGNTDSTRVLGTLQLTSARSFSVTQSGTGGQGYVATGSAALQTIANVDIKTVTGASAAIETIDGALEKVLSMRSEVGALQNRLERVVESLTNMVTKTTEAVSRIVDADFAEETAKLTRAQVLQQAGTAMLAQANQSKQSVLALLQ